MFLLKTSNSISVYECPYTATSGV